MPYYHFRKNTLFKKVKSFFKRDFLWNETLKSAILRKIISEKVKTRKKLIGSTIVDIWMHLLIDTDLF